MTKENGDICRKSAKMENIDEKAGVKLSAFFFDKIHKGVEDEEQAPLCTGSKRKAVRPMMINNTIQAVAGAYSTAASPTTAKAKAKESTAVSAKDEIVLSSEAKSFSATLQQLKGMDDVRQEKVDFYTNQIAEDTYAVDAGMLADKMLQMRY